MDVHNRSSVALQSSQNSQGATDSAVCDSFSESTVSNLLQSSSLSITSPSNHPSLPSKDQQSSTIRHHLSQLSQLLDASVDHDTAVRDELRQLREHKRKSEEIIEDYREKRQKSLSYIRDLLERRNLEKFEKEKKKLKFELEATQAVIEATRAIAEREKGTIRSELESQLEKERSDRDKERGDWVKEKADLKEEVEGLRRRNQKLEAFRRQIVTMGADLAKGEQEDRS